MEKACLVHVSLADNHVDVLRPHADMYYSASYICKQYCVFVRERAATEALFRRHVLRTFKKLQIKVKCYKGWLQLIPERHARELIDEPVDPDSRIIVLSRRN